MKTLKTLVINNPIREKKVCLCRDVNLYYEPFCFVRSHVTLIHVSSLQPKWISSTLSHDQMIYFSTSPPHSSVGYLLPSPKTKWDIFLHLLPTAKWDIFHPIPRPNDIFFYISSPQLSGISFTLPQDQMRYFSTSPPHSQMGYSSTLILLLQIKLCVVCTFLFFFDNCSILVTEFLARPMMYASYSRRLYCHLIKEFFFFIEFKEKRFI